MAPPPLLEQHAELLRERGYRVEIVEDGSRYLVILRDVRLPDSHYEPPVVDLMVLADYQYPVSRLDMFWTRPPVTLKQGGAPRSAEVFEEYAGERWQRWSWHYDGWDPSRHSLLSHVEVVLDRLARCE